MNIKFPLQFDHRGRTATCDDDRHIREMIEQVLFTSPGERPMRPDFGCGILQLVFAGNSGQLAAALQVAIQSSLQRWLGDVLQVDELQVTNDESILRIELRYLVLRTGERRQELFERRNVA